MVRLGLIGLGKMGLSHLAIVRAHPDAQLVAVCDNSGYILDVLAKYTGLNVYTDYKKMLREEKLDGIIVATPSRLHGEIVRAALDMNLHVFCEKPFCLDPVEGRELAELAQKKNLVNQVGYHYRFVGAFQEAKRLIDTGAIGRIHNIRAEAYGPVVLRPKNATWRALRSEGGGCLYDYACHAMDLMNFLVGKPEHVGGTVLNKIFSNDVEDEVYSTFFFPNGLTGQIASNWSDESHRKMFVKISLWGSGGRLSVDRQEIQLYTREENTATKLKKGWTTLYTTEVSENPFFYLRGEEYSAQIDHFVRSIVSGDHKSISSFGSAVETDELAAMMVQDAQRGPEDHRGEAAKPTSTRPGLLRGLKALFPASSAT